MNIINKSVIILLTRVTNAMQFVVLPSFLRSHGGRIYALLLVGESITPFGINQSERKGALLRLVKKGETKRQFRSVKIKWGICSPEMGYPGTLCVKPFGL